MIIELYKILREVGISSQTIDQRLDEYKAQEKRLHEECEVGQKHKTKQWLGESDAAEGEFDRCLKRAPVSDQLRRRGIRGAYELDEMHLWAEYKLGIKDLRTRHKTGEIRKIIEILERVISTMREEFKGRDIDKEYFEDEYKLVAFDVDGTLVDSSNYFPNIWWVLNKEFGTGKGDKGIEERYRRGEITYQQWVDEILSLYMQRGVNREMFLRAIEPIKPVRGAQETLQQLKERCKKLAVISGSLDIILEKAFPDNPFDYVEINKIHFDNNGNITGWEATPYGDGRGKAIGLMDIARRESRKMHGNFSLRNCVYVGDGRNDIQAIEAAGLGIAFYPSDFYLKRACDVEIERRPYEKKDLRRILRYIL